VIMSPLSKETDAFLSSSSHWEKSRETEIALATTDVDLLLKRDLWP